MISLMHFDSDRYLGIVQYEDIQLAVMPPYERNSTKKINKHFTFEKPMATYDNFPLIFNELREEARMATLNRLMHLWIKMSHSSVAPLNPEKTKATLLKTMEREFGQGGYSQNDIRDLATMHMAFGFSEKQIQRIDRITTYGNEELKKSLKYFLTIKLDNWRDNLPGFFSHIKYRMIPDQRFEEAHNALKAMKMYRDDIGEEESEIIDKLTDLTKANLVALARARGDNLAKPWQKWLYN